MGDAWVIHPRQHTKSKTSSANTAARRLQNWSLAT